MWADDPPPLEEFNPYRRACPAGSPPVVVATDDENREAWAMVRTGLKQIARGG